MLVVMIIGAVVCAMGLLESLDYRYTPTDVDERGYP